jgi:hypothetical protein
MRRRMRDVGGLWPSTIFAAQPSARWRPKANKVEGIGSGNQAVSALSTPLVGSLLLPCKERGSSPGRGDEVSLA